MKKTFCDICNNEYSSWDAGGHLELLGKTCKTMYNLDLCDSCLASMTATISTELLRIKKLGGSK